jgi:hypothetical protein
MSKATNRASVLEIPTTSSESDISARRSATTLLGLVVMFQTSLRIYEKGADCEHNFTKWRGGGSAARFGGGL